MLAIVCFVLIAGIVFYQGVQGLFSALIMAMCTLAVTLVAFSYYEPLAALLYKYDTQYVQAVCLVLLTFVPLVVLRYFVDKYLPGNVVPSPWVDRIGGGAFGLVTALLLTGTFAIAAQMLPWGRGVAAMSDTGGYSAFDDTLAHDSSFLVNAPASFTLGTVKLMSSGSGLKGKQSFAMLHDDLVLEMWAARNRDEVGGAPPQKSWKSDEIKIPVVARNTVKPDSLKVIKVVDATKQPLAGGTNWTLGTRAAAWPMDPSAAEGRSRVFVTRVSVNRDAADKDGWWRLRATQFRLVTKDGGSFYPVGYLLRKGGWVLVEDANGIGKLEINRPSDKEAQLPVDWVYRVPNLPGDTGREPWFMTFRRIAQAAVGPVAEGMIEGGGLQQRNVVGQVAVRPPAGSAKGTFILQSIEALVTPELPVSFGANSREGDIKSENGKIVARLKSSAFVDGTVAGANTKDDLFKGANTIDQFYQPGGKCVMRLSCKPPSSEAVRGFGRSIGAVAFAPYAQTQEGPSYQALGAWAKWKEGAVETNYMFFEPEPNKELGIDTTGMTGSGGGPFAQFKKMLAEKPDQMTDCGLLFLVPADATIVSFTFAENTPASMCDSPMKVSQ